MAVQSVDAAAQHHPAGQFQFALHFGQHLRPAGRFLIQYFLAGPFQRPLDTRHPGCGQQREMRGGAAQHFGGDLLQLRQAAVACGDPIVEHLVGKIAAHHRGGILIERI